MEKKIMKRTISFAKHLAVAVFFAQLPTLLRADCLPSGPTGDTVPFTLVMLKNTRVASYTTGTLTISNSDIPYSVDHSTTLSGTQEPQLFSDRTFCPSSGVCLTGEQPFDLSAADKLGVSITEATTLVLGSGIQTSISVTLTLESWGNSKTTFTATCNNAGELYGTSESNTSALLHSEHLDHPRPRHRSKINLRPQKTFGPHLTRRPFFCTNTVTSILDPLSTYGVQVYNTCNQRYGLFGEMPETVAAGFYRGSRSAQSSRSEVTPS
jgi:hypothetical protein